MPRISDKTNGRFRKGANQNDNDSSRSVAIFQTWTFFEKMVSLPFKCGLIAVFCSIVAKTGGSFSPLVALHTT